MKAIKRGDGSWNSSERMKGDFGAKGMGMMFTGLVLEVYIRIFLPFQNLH